MNVKKTKKFKENRPENFHVHDRSIKNKGKHRGIKGVVVRATLPRRSQ